MGWQENLDVVLETLQDIVQTWQIRFALPGIFDFYQIVVHLFLADFPTAYSHRTLIQSSLGFNLCTRMVCYNVFEHTFLYRSIWF